MPLTTKGQTIEAAMVREYGPAKGRQVFYASARKGVIAGVERGGRRRRTMTASFHEAFGVKPKKRKKRKSAKRKTPKAAPARKAKKSHARKAPKRKAAKRKRAKKRAKRAKTRQGGRSSCESRLRAARRELRAIRERGVAPSRRAS